MPIGPIEKKCDAVIRLTKSQQARLGEIAGALHCYSGSGPTTGQPSWRTMVGGIADGVLRVTNPKAKREDSPPKESSRRGGKKNKRELIPGAPNWWRPFYGNAMGEEYALKASGLSLPELLAIGMRSEFNPLLTHPEIVVGLPEWPAAFSPSRPHWWWNPDPDSTMDIDVAVKMSGLTLEQMTAGGMIADHEISRIMPPEEWVKWTKP